MQIPKHVALMLVGTVGMHCLHFTSFWFQLNLGYQALQLTTRTSVPLRGLKSDITSSKSVWLYTPMSRRCTCPPDLSVKSPTNCFDTCSRKHVRA
jgi:hypothetical protein